MLKKLQIKFICINMLIVTVMLAIIFGMVFHFTGESLEAESLRMMQALATGPVHQAIPSEPLAGFRLPYLVIQIGTTGDLTISGAGYGSVSDAAFLEEIIEAAFTADTQSGVLKEQHLRFLRVSVPGGERIVFADTSIEEATMRNLIQNCILIGLVSFVLFFGLSLLFSRWAIRPVSRAWDQQKQFVADASHELKTPLTVIMTNAELLQSPDYEPAARQRFAGNILTMSRQMRGLVENLLALARADNSAERAVFSILDFSELTEDALLPFEPLYFEKGLMLESQIQENIRLRGSESQLRQVIDILLDNALKYSDNPGTVTLRLAVKSGHCLLSIANPGPAISKEDLKNIFKRFYRIDSARTMNRSYGLGLSIAETITLNHHGRIWAESKEGMITFFVQLPM